MAVTGKTAAPWEEPYFLSGDQPPDMAAVTKALADKTHANLAKIVAEVLGSSRVKLTAGVKRTSANTALVSGAGLVDLPGTTLEISPSVPSLLFVVATWNYVKAGVGASFTGKLRLDGADHPEGVFTQNGGGTDAYQRDMATQVYELNLSAAAHTVKMRAAGVGSPLEASAGTSFLYLLLAA